MQEVVIRTLAQVVRAGVTLDGRLVDALGHLAVSYSVPMWMHPVLLLVSLFGSQENPDRDTEQGSMTLDALLGTLLEVGGDYKTALYTLATLARQHGLEATSDRAVELLEELADKDRTHEQAQHIQETVLSKRPEMRSDDDLSWVIKLILTMATITAFLAVAGKISGSLGELLSFLDAFGEERG